MPRFNSHEFREFLEVARRWALVEDRRVKVEITFQGHGILNREPEMKMKCWAFDHTFCEGFFAEKKEDFLTSKQLAEMARQSALKKLELLERRCAA